MALPNDRQFKRSFVLALFVFALFSQHAKCQGTILDSLFTFRSGIVKTGTALDIISRHTGYNFTYDSHLINPEKKVGMTFTNARLSSVLDSILKNDSLNYSIIDRYIIISRTVHSPVLRIDSPIHDMADYISGTVIDDESGEPLPSASIAIRHKGKGTIANASGEFSLRITSDCLPDTLNVSFIGFVSREIPVKNSLGNNFSIRMKREYVSIPEIIIRTKIPQEIIYKAVAAIPENYGNTPAMLTGFYREGVMKKQELQIYSEAVVQIYKSAYTASLVKDQMRIYKSRKIENTKTSDTLAIRLKAGLSTCLDLDVIKNLVDFLSRETMPEYSYRITDIVSTDDETAYVIDFEQKEGVDLPRYRGSVYINADDYAIVRVEFELHPKFIREMKDSFITKESHEYNTWPVSVKYSISYRKINNRYFMDHVRGDLVFSSKQKKKLFSTQFNVFFELAVTGVNTASVSRFERNELAPLNSIFSETIKDYDAGFWGDQDFLKPEDNLLQALKNMKVKMQEFPGNKN
ncbi:MAG: carboxypeptidase-like regulatory domain-containing protein [Bacteroidales bacterium]|jgi:hypothetical protein